MPDIEKPRAVKRSLAVKPQAETSAAETLPRRSRKNAGSGPSADRDPAQLPATVTSPPAPLAAPGRQRRKRLAKAFERPLDKVLRKQSSEPVNPAREPATVRDGFTFPKAEHDVLVSIKKRLADQGVMVKKSELVRVGILLLSSLSQERLKTHLARLSPVN